jgi:hypothetical protein
MGGLDGGRGNYNSYNSFNNAASVEESLTFSMTDHKSFVIVSSIMEARYEMSQMWLRSYCKKWIYGRLTTV